MIPQQPPMTPREVYNRLQGLRYRSRTDGGVSYYINSAKRTLEEGSANCFEGALVAAYLMEHQGHPPRLLDIPVVSSHGGLALAVMYYEAGGRFGGITRSRLADLEWRDPEFSTLATLAASYRGPLNNAGYRAAGWGEFDLAAVEVSWRDGDDDMAGLSRVICAVTDFQIFESDELSGMQPR